jgi:hypothetical protein
MVFSKLLQNWIAHQKIPEVARPKLIVRILHYNVYLVKLFTTFRAKFPKLYVTHFMVIFRKKKKYKLLPKKHHY